MSLGKNEKNRPTELFQLLIVYQIDVPELIPMLADRSVNNSKAHCHTLLGSEVSVTRQLAMRVSPWAMLSILRLTSIQRTKN